MIKKKYLLLTVLLMGAVFTSDLFNTIERESTIQNQIQLDDDEVQPIRPS